MLRPPIEQTYPRINTSAPHPAPGTELANRARWFALAGAVLWLYAAWAPWTTRCSPIAIDGLLTCKAAYYEDVVYPRYFLDPIALRSFAPGAVGWALDPVLWGALTPLGLLIAICLWSRRLGVVARIALAIWLVFMGSMAAIALDAWIVVMSIPAPPGSFSPFRMGQGMFAVLAALLSWLGAGLCVALRFVRRGPHRLSVQAGGDSAHTNPGQVTPTDAVPRRVWRVAGALMLTLGIACWGYSWLFLRWTPVQDPNDCLATPPDCLGISAARAMELGSYLFKFDFNPLIFQYTVPVLFAGSAAIALYVAWWPRLGARHWLGIALWLVLITLAYSVANRGVAEIPYGFGFIGFNPASFLPETLAGFGIGVGFASLIPLFAVLYRRPLLLARARYP